MKSLSAPFLRAERKFVRFPTVRKWRAVVGIQLAERIYTMRWVSTASGNQLFFLHHLHLDPI
jgi:hypothetical protein